MTFPHLYVDGTRVPFHATRLPVRCAACGSVHCVCPDPVYQGVIPPSRANPPGAVNCARSLAELHQLRPGASFSDLLHAHPDAAGRDASAKGKNSEISR